MKEELGLATQNKAHENALGAFDSFVAFVAMGAVFSAISLVLIPFVLLYSVLISIWKLWQLT